jgi:hypothetical protein
MKKSKKNEEWRTGGRPRKGVATSLGMSRESRRGKEGNPFLAFRVDEETLRAAIRACGSRQAVIDAMRSALASMGGV